MSLCVERSILKKTEQSETTLRHSSVRYSIFCGSLFRPLEVSYKHRLARLLCQLTLTIVQHYAILPVLSLGEDHFHIFVSHDMKLKYKILLLYIGVSILILVSIGTFLSSRLQKMIYTDIYDDFQNQLSHIDFAL